MRNDKYCRVVSGMDGAQILLKLWVSVRVFFAMISWYIKNCHGMNTTMIIVTLKPWFCHSKLSTLNEQKPWTPSLLWLKFIDLENIFLKIEDPGDDDARSLVNLIDFLKVLIEFNFSHLKETLNAYITDSPTGLVSLAVPEN